MILVTYKEKYIHHLGLYINNKVYNYAEAAKACGVKKNVIKTMTDFLTLWKYNIKEFHGVHDKIKSGEVEFVFANSGNEAMNYLANHNHEISIKSLAHEVAVTP